MTYTLPGTVIAREEEYIGGTNTFTDDEGNICATTIGKSNINKKELEISVTGNEKIKIGDIVEGEVSLVRDKMIVIRVRKVFDRNNNPKSRYINSASVFVTNICQSYLEKTADAAKIGDLAKGKIVKMDGNLIDISFKGEDLGILKAFCSRCRTHLKILKTDFKNRDLKEMICPNCKHKEKRKTAKGYI